MHIAAGRAKGGVDNSRRFISAWLGVEKRHAQRLQSTHRLIKRLYLERDDRRRVGAMPLRDRGIVAFENLQRSASDVEDELAFGPRPQRQLQDVPIEIQRRAQIGRHHQERSELHQRLTVMQRRGAWPGRPWNSTLGPR